MKEFAKLYPDFTSVKNVDEACEGADVVVLFTGGESVSCLRLCGVEGKDDRGRRLLRLVLHIIAPIASHSMDFQSIVC